MEAVAQQVADYLSSNKLVIATAESCTGGLVAKLLTDVAGSSQWFERGYVTYSNQAKIEMLGVSELCLTQFGAVSSETVEAMVSGVLNKTNVDAALSISGIAGPSGGSADKPVGLVYFAWLLRDRDVKIEKRCFTGNREEIRYDAAIYALRILIEYLQAQIDH